MKKLLTIFILLSAPLCILAQPEYFEGPRTVYVGHTITYWYNGSSGGGGTWSIYGGGASIQSQTADYAQVYINSASSFYLSHWNNYDGTKEMFVTVYTVPPTPSAPFIALTECSQITLQMNTGQIPSDIEWFWQTTPNGQSTSLGSNYQTIASSGTYYLQSRSTYSPEVWGGTSSGITINLPARPVDGTITASQASICLGQSVTIYGNGGTGTPHYWASTNGGSSWNIFADAHVGEASFSFTPSSAGTYRFHFRNQTTYCGFCWDPGNTCTTYPYVDVVVKPVPTYSGELFVNNSSVNACAQGTVLLDVTNSPATSYFWISYVDANNNTISVEDATTFSLPYNYPVSVPGQWTFTTRAQNECGTSPATSRTITVWPKPGQPQVSGINPICAGSTVTLHATPHADGNHVRWYENASGGSPMTPNSGTDDVTTPALNASRQYWVTSYLNSVGCEGDRYSTNVTVRELPTTANAGPDQTTNATCGLTSVAISANVPSVGTGSWSIVNGSGGWFAPGPGNVTSTSASTTFSGTAGSTYLLRWTISNSPCTASTDDVTITFNRNPTTANAGPDQIGAGTCGATSALLSANSPSTGTGAWSIVSGTGGTVVTPASPSTTFTGLTGSTYVLRWTISNNPCGTSTDDVTITFNRNPTTANAGSDQTLSCGVISTTLAGNSPTVGTGAWGIISGSGGTITSPSSPTSAFTGSPGSNYVLRWTISNAPCASSTDDVNITLTTPAIPQILSVTSASCGPKVMTRGAPPGGIGWYWQGKNSTGTDISTSIANAVTYEVSGSGTYYLGAKNGTCWNYRSIVVDVDVADLVLTSYDPANTLIQATNSITFGPNFFVPQGSTFTAKVAVTPECNDQINWTESIAYNESGSPIGSSKSYFDGQGKSLMSQSKDYLSQKVFASQPLYNIYGMPMASTLTAPIIEKEFIYKRNFVRNSDNQPYGANDFDLRTTTGAAGEINNPKPVGEQPGSLGWYYSSSNNLEPLTATTDYPYARSYTPEGPDPTTSKSAGPGDAFRMGAGHEGQSERQNIAIGDLDHYYNLRHHFVTTSSTFNPNLLAFVSTGNTSQFTGYYASIASASGYISVTCNAGSTTPGVWPIGGAVTVTPGKTYTFRAKGYRNSGATTPVNLYVAHGTAVADFVWPGAALPTGSANEAWVSSTFTVPSGVTSVRVGLLWNGANGGTVGQSFMISAVELVADAPVASTGYKFISTDPDGKKVVSFVDADGHGLASATLSGSTFDNWSYSYYNDLGQLVASVAPNGVNTASTAYPQFVTLYIYDHLGRLIETTSTDEGTSRFVYSTDGKIRFSENQVQRDATPKRFSYTNYDYMGRLLESGEYSSSSGGYIFEPHTTTTPASNSVLNLVDQVGQSAGVTRKIGGQQGYISDYTYIEYDVQAIDFPEVSPVFQENLDGQVAKTENENSITWYSYDEFGQVVKTWQKIININIANPAVIKTIDYTYDYFGNVTEVAYQKNTATDRFYHHYTYDLNNRLTEVRTSKDGVNKTLQATYLYYLHGPLKKVILANNLQGIDYTYTIDGSLKGINHADPAKDPGADGTDKFGETLQYFDGDYQGAGYSAGSQTVSGYNNQYSGLLKATSWHSPADNNQKRTYAYEYDSRNELTNAIWGDMTGTAGSYTFNPASSQQHREGASSYDKNGNIQSLIRKGKLGNTTANYAYVYESNTNKLDKVNHNAAQLVDYTYNSIGQMIKQDEGASKTFNIIYNAYGLVKEVKNNSNILVQSYFYDDRGNLLQRVGHNTSGVPQKYTTYISDVAGNVLAIYDQSGTTTLATLPLEVPVYGAGRIAVHKPAANVYFYEINDHLGNVRAVIGVPSATTYSASFETGFAGSGQNDFTNYISSTYDLVDHTDAGTTYQQVHLLNGGASGRVGLAKSFSVSPGDKVKIDAYGKFRNLTGNGNSTSFITALASTFGVSSSSTGDQLNLYNGLNSYAGSVPGGEHSGDNDLAPKAFVTILLFDKNYNLLDAAWDQIDASAEQVSGSVKTPPLHDLLTKEVTVTEQGFSYVFLSNEHPYYVDIYFDDVAVTHTQSPIVAGADYYPYGLPMDGREITDEPYRYGYQGQFSEKDLTTGWNEFELRLYDARFGRWLSPDPQGQFASPYLGMGNIPNLSVDPDGGMAGNWNSLVLGDLMRTIDLPEVVITASRIPGRAISTAALTAGIRASGNIPGHPKWNGPVVIDERSWFYKNVIEPVTDNIYGISRSIAGDLTPEFHSGNSNKIRDREIGEHYLGPVVQMVFNGGASLKQGPSLRLQTTNNVTIPLKPSFIAPPVNAQNVHNMSSIGFNLSSLETIWKNPKWFLNWLKNNHSLSRIKKPLNATEAQQIIDNAKKLGLTIESNLKGLQGLEITGQWAGVPHFKVGNVHIPIETGLDGVLIF